MAPLWLLNSGGRTIAGPPRRQASVAGVTPQSALAGIPSRPISAWRLSAYFQIEAGNDGRRIREKVTGKVLSVDRALEPSLPALLGLLAPHHRHDDVPRDGHAILAGAGGDGIPH
jgi:hypothetical protein